MKNIYLFLFSFISLISFSQIKLTSFPIELKRSAENHQMMNFVDKNSNEIYTFVADKETVIGVKFNSAVFVSDSIATSKPFNFQYIIGYSFSKENNPTVHWITEDNKKIMSIEYDFSKNPKDYTATETIFSNESILASFSNNGVFYIITDNDKNDMKLYEFGTQNNTTTLPSGNLNFTDSKDKPIKISQVFIENPLVRMETNFYNPLMATAEKVKFYVENNRAIFTFDLNRSKTEILEIDLNSKTISKKEYQQSTLENGSNQSNSYYLNEKLFQVKSNEKQLLLRITDCYSKTVIKEYSLSEKENPFEYSSFLIQTEQYKPETLSSLKRFLRKIENSNLAFSIFQINEGYVVSFGANKTSASSGGLAFGIGVGIGSILASGTFVDVGNFDNSRTQSVFLDFDCDANFNIIPPKNTVLATSIISGFIAQNDNIRLYQTFPYRDYFVLSYYDKKAKQVVLYKFQNGFN
ncbi:MAG: hypothetical protein LCH35_03630 [Bacteroidetes bacterium]|uniref:hypothetical protein n=1 Tax=Flavobacterium sp. TaxID=239 RepID=UPI002FD8F7D0|nr:hypothetical protein [Bacteroidota bacterium]